MQLFVGYIWRLQVFLYSAVNHVAVVLKEWVSLIAGMEYGMERWNGIWNGTVKWKME